MRKWTKVLDFLSFDAYVSLDFCIAQHELKKQILKCLFRIDITSTDVSIFDNP